MTKLLTETADYDEPGSWGRASDGWPEESVERQVKSGKAYAPRWW